MFYGNHILVDLFNIIMLLILSGSGFSYFYLLFRRYQNRKANPILTMSIASLGIGGGSVFLLIMYMTEKLVELDLLKIIENLGNLGGNGIFHVEPYIFFTIIIISMVDVSMFEFIFLIFEIPSKENRKKIYLIGISLLLVSIIIYLALYFTAIMLQLESAWFVIFIETFILFIGILAVLIGFFLTVLIQGRRVMSRIEKSDENYDRIKYMSLWCLFGGLFFSCIIIVMILQLFGIHFGIVLSFAVASSYCVYRAYIKH